MQHKNPLRHTYLADPRDSAHVTPVTNVTDCTNTSPCNRTINTLVTLYDHHFNQ